MESNPESKYLGKKSEIPKYYEPDVLVSIPRIENRKQYGICEKPTIFSGFDVWHVYEFSFLTDNGLPVAGMLKIVYPSSNLFIVESKSLKLYLNSFNMSKFGNTKRAGLEIVLKTIRKDLEAILNCSVEVAYFDNDTKGLNDFTEYEKLETVVEVESLKFDSFNENPALLKIEADTDDEIKVYSDLLRSNCKVTHQPDWGSVFIHIKSNNKIDKSSLLRYLVSFRNENHFHEEVCEMIYKRLWDKLSPELLMVTCIYTRRGGIDICPVRSNKPEFLPKSLIASKQQSFKLYRQ